ncbi:hypothetical protein K504DRAFT_537752 [Pleomassaria siparia CBS 279.74]|uniref:Uncharacterized protein n=1 Tax=Pleomassaria siparia CBS 279.74 TaxID=1314801 RepID=A0A6G1JWM5_9PLEO|nr:hypothetical protein K504DRAFT_537752 [Pleomassaria siparia CBS 279.74]
MPELFSSEKRDDGKRVAANDDNVFNEGYHSLDRATESLDSDILQAALVLEAMKDYNLPSGDDDDEDDNLHQPDARTHSDSVYSRSTKSRRCDTVYGIHEPPLETSVHYPLKLVSYWRYKSPIALYHLSTPIIPTSTIRRALTQNNKTFVHTLLGPDPLQDVLVPEGDETPLGNIEVIYLPNIFQGKGSAVGFRDTSKIKDGVGVKVEWLCFQSCVGPILENARAQHGEEGLDKVGFVEKGISNRAKGIKTNREHKSWVWSIRDAKLKPVKLKLTWKNKEKERMESLARTQQPVKGNAKVQEMKNCIPATKRLTEKLAQHKEKVQETKDSSPAKKRKLNFRVSKNRGLLTPDATPYPERNLSKNLGDWDWNEMAVANTCY